MASRTWLRVIGCTRLTLVGCAQVGYPSRTYVWVMARKPEMPRSVLDDIKKRLVTDHQYPEGLPDLVEVPQSWDRDATAQFGWKRRGVDASPK